MIDYTRFMYRIKNYLFAWGLLATALFLMLDYNSKSDYLKKEMRDGIILEKYPLCGKTREFFYFELKDIGTGFVHTRLVPRKVYGAYDVGDVYSGNFSLLKVEENIFRHLLHFFLPLFLVITLISLTLLILLFFFTFHLSRKKDILKAE